MIQYWHKTIKSKKFKQLDSHKAGSWIYVEDPTDAEQQILTDTFKIDEGMLEDALDIDEVPRFETEDNIHYVFTRFPLTDTNLQVVTVPILIAISGSYIMTISLRPIPRLEKIMNSTEANTTQRVKLLLNIIDHIVDDYERHLTAISKQIISVRNRLRVEQVSNKDFIGFVTIEDELNDFMSALVPTNTLLKRLMTGRHIKLFEEDIELIEDLLLSNEQSIESAKSNIKTIVSIREAYSTISTNNLNQVIRLLTSLTVVLTVPTIIASLYGMNVDLPFQNEPGAFVIVISSTIIVSSILILIFRKNKWL
ncbi:TPA: magnesium transporter CorA family protein [Candidatus Saccharibacteria bacterium]|nr:magnesium transporter CorA family protein [Candidatus Saccharibacteria bacterium]HIO87884.1 magnesium transporter CorA family protein [Candidatus Saccharibacteria bacterium]